MFSDITLNRAVISHPREYAHNKRQLHLYQFEDQDTNEGHVLSIINLGGYFNASRTYCVACRLSWGGRNYKHICSKDKLRPTCTSCRNVSKSKTKSIVYPSIMTTMSSFLFSKFDCQTHTSMRLPKANIVTQQCHRQTG